MYLQLTTKCNMACDHCGFSCSPKRGEHMDLKTYKAALDLAEDRGSTLSIGGGEPTLHPQFWEFLGLALGRPYLESLWMATNGKKTETALALAGLARKGVLGGALSRDPWHDEISLRVVAAFTQDKAPSDYREIRDVSRNVINTGRAKRNQLGLNFTECICDDLFVAPDGKLFACGCKKESFGTVFKPKIPEDYCENDYCSSKAKRSPEPAITQEEIEYEGQLALCEET